MPMTEIDVVLFGEETVQGVIDALDKRFGVTAVVAPQQYNASVTLEIHYSTDDQLRRLTDWHNASRSPRKDLKGVPPVAKGERRTNR